MLIGSRASAAAAASVTCIDDDDDDDGTDGTNDDDNGNDDDDDCNPNAPPFRSTPTISLSIPRNVRVTAARKYSFFSSDALP
jgi:hypothetical protein